MHLLLLCSLSKFWNGTFNLQLQQFQDDALDKHLLLSSRFVLFQSPTNFAISDDTSNFLVKKIKANVADYKV